MKTEDLIDMLSSDIANKRQQRPRPLPVAVLVSGVFSLLLMLGLLGLRLDWFGWQAWFGLAMKLLISAVVLALALSRLRQVIRPEVSLQGTFKVFAVPLLAVLLLAFGSLLVRSPASWSEAIRGETLLVCVTAIPLLALPVLAGVLWTLRNGAVTDTLRGGLLAGLLAGAAAVLVYSLHCTEDDPAFYGIWYTVGILLSMLIGAVAGQRVLRW